MIADRRKDERFLLGGDYYYYPGNSKDKFDCMVKNISVTGSCIVSGNAIVKNEIIFLHIGCGRNIELKSQVMWKQDSRYGLMFLLENSDDFDNISYIINNEALRINK